MKSHRIACLALLALTAGLVSQAHAQTRSPARADTVRVYEEVVLRDGSRIVGIVISETATTLTIRSSSGLEATIEKAQILSRRAVEGRERDGQFTAFDPNRTRLFFAPTGRPIRQGGGYVAAYEVFFGLVAYGLTDRLSAAGGTLLFPEAFGDIIYIAPKLTVLENGLHATAVGVFAGTVTADLFDDEVGWAGLLYAAHTVGHPDRAVTVGAGFPFAEGDVNTAPILMLGGELGVSRSVKFITENYVLTGADGTVIISGGLRFYGERLAADFALFGSATEGGFVPWLSFAYNFGK